MRNAIDQINFNYTKIGYKYLRLIKVTDAKWLRNNWGEPKQHQQSKEVNEDLWNKVNDSFVKLEKEAEEKFYEKINKTQNTKQDKNNNSCLTGCLVVIAIIFFIILIGIFL
ncbi:MAG: hypothetical protein ACOC56_01825 [Atribacterota bacterium]